jgi:hypothetical protein
MESPMWKIFQRILRRREARVRDPRAENRLMANGVTPCHPEPVNDEPGDPPLKPAEPISEERRAWVRYPCNVESRCHLHTGRGEMHWSARTQDISRGGLELLTERRFERGTILTIKAAAAECRDLPTFMAQVVRVSGPVNDKWVLGCRLGKEISETDLREFLDVAHP